MYCSQCGEQISDNSKYCSFCGARVDNHSMNDNYGSVEKPLVDQQKLEQDIRKGTLIYLHDVLSMEFSINKLQHQLRLAENPIIIHDDWYYWKCYDLVPKIFGHDWNAPLTKLYLCYFYRLNRYYYSFEEKKVSNFYDRNGNEVHHQFGQPGYRLSVMDQKTRDQFFTMPTFKNKLFSGPVLTNSDLVFWQPGIIYKNLKTYGNLNWYAQIKQFVEQFEVSVRQREEDYRGNLPQIKKKIRDIKEELENAKRIRDDLYSLNIIPSKYRNIGCVYFIYDYFSTSNTPLNTVFLHMDLDKIQSQLNTVIKNQQDSMLQQAIIISQNEELIAQNQQLFDELSNMNRSVNRINTNLNSISESSSETSQWAKMAALNARTCAWISVANYIKG